MRLCYFPINVGWAFVFGPDIRTATPLVIYGFPLFFATKGEAIEAARHRGLIVNLADNTVTPEEGVEAVTIG
jgi:hypothetical protein